MSAATQMLTVNEAASVTCVPARQVNRIIDAGLLVGRVKTLTGNRVIVRNGLVGLRLAFLMADTLTPKARKRIVGQAISGDVKDVVEDAELTVKIEPIATLVEAGLKRLDRVNALVSVDPDVHGGAPCFTGTRILVHAIAEMRAHGERVEAIEEAYPALTHEQIELASVYAEAYPRRGRPPVKPRWKNSQPKSTMTITLEDLPTLP
jgi:uncharacterized protein (DUF433 family)